MKAGRLIAVLLLVAVAVALGVMAISAHRSALALDAAQQRIRDLESQSASTEQSESLFWGQHLSHLSSIEPVGDAAIYGVYRARIVKVDGSSFTFDWLGYTPDPHGGTQRTNERDHLQTLTPEPMSFIKLLDKDGRPVTAILPDTLESFQSQNASSAALLESDWWVGVSGSNWVELIQAD